MNPRPTVWVLKEQVKQGPNGPQPIDYSAAYEFGDIRFITDIDPPLLTHSTVLDVWKSQVAEFIRSYEPERDFIILTGSPLAIAKLGRYLGQLNSAHPMRVLVWRREQGRYVPTTL